MRSDLYALGLILYETVTATSAFTVSSPREWVSVHALSAPSHPSMIVSDVDLAVERAILRCLEKDPANREPDWAPLLAAIGADAPPVPSARRRWPSAHLSDTRVAWTAKIDGVPSEVEAAAPRGRPVSLRIRPAGAPDEYPVPPRVTMAWFSYVTPFILNLVPALLVVLARRNMRLGRGDRRGATRVAIFTFVTLGLYFLVDRHWSPVPADARTVHRLAS